MQPKAIQTRSCARSRPARPLISLIAPCYNEADTIDAFVDAVGAALSGCDFDYELVFVDDGSSDGTLARLSVLALRSNIRVVVLSRNFGKEAALTAGLDHARGDAIVVIDVDL
ncbi:MAG: glycosyltransferase, partial [Pseudomonadota bacterium]